MAHQLSFEDALRPSPARADGHGQFANDFVDVERHDLDGSSWVEVVPGFLRDPDRLFDRLHDELEWSQRKRWIYDRKVDEPRLTADYPDIAAAPTEELRVIADRLSEAYGLPYDGVWVNQYRDHHDSTSWHGDYASCRRAVCTVPVLTLGHPRRFLIKPVAGGRSTRFIPQNGDLLVMRGRCQVDWRHAVPKQTGPATTRISVNYQSSRQMVPDGG